MASSREDLHHLVEELPAEQVSRAARVLAALREQLTTDKIIAVDNLLTDTSSAASDQPVLRDFGGFLGSVDAEPDFAERSEEILRDRFRGDHGAA